jgi:hypothetical protein
VEKNVDVFYKDVPDGVRCIAFGRVVGIDKPLVIVGGHCSIQGFDHEGKETFWTVAGDTVTAMTFFDYTAPDDRSLGAPATHAPSIPPPQTVHDMTAACALQGGAAGGVGRLRHPRVQGGGDGD